MSLGPHRNQVADRTDWGTPLPLFRKYDAIYGFTLDVCASPENAKCARFFTPEQDGLTQDWGAEVCWMNPPYGRETAKWMKKAHSASLRGATVVCLIPSRTDSKWWHDYAERGEYEFIKGRIVFEGARWNAPFPSAVVAFRPATSLRSVA